MKNHPLFATGLCLAAIGTSHSLSFTSPVHHRGKAWQHLTLIRGTITSPPHILSAFAQIKTEELVTYETGECHDIELGNAFAQKLLELEKYRQEYGHCLVPKRYDKNPSLGNWVNKQRQNYRKFLRGENSSMNQQRINALNNVGFIWDATSIPQSQRSSHSDRAWNKMFLELKKFHKTHGHCQVPSSISLGQWVVRMRFLYRQDPSGKAKLALTQERIDLLNSISFSWSTRSEAIWRTRVEQLREFKREHSHCMVPRNYPENPQLSTWVATQRKNYNKKQQGKPTPLTQERIDQLEALEFVWSYWDHNFMSSDYNVNGAKLNEMW